MPKALKSAKHGRPRKGNARSETAHLDKLIEEATVDCYNESEEVTGIFTMLEQSLAVPFVTKLLGIEVTVERIDMNKAGEIVAVCRRGRERLRVPVIDLPLPEPKPKGRNGSMLTGDGLDGDEDGVTNLVKGDVDGYV